MIESHYHQKLKSYFNQYLILDNHDVGDATVDDLLANIQRVLDCVEMDSEIPVLQEMHIDLKLDTPAIPSPEQRRNNWFDQILDYLEGLLESQIENGKSIDKIIHTALWLERVQDHINSPFMEINSKGEIS